MGFLTVVISAVLLLVALGVLLFALSWLLSVLAGSQVVHTHHQVFPHVVELARLAPGERFLELGSGQGDLCAYVARETGARATGVDINPLLVAYARWRHRGNPDLQFHVGNVHRTPLLREATVIYCYLLPPMLRKLAPRFKTELKAGTRVISHAFPLPDIKPTETIPASADMAALYLYQL